jgi:hypothetical protein
MSLFRLAERAIQAEAEARADADRKTSGKETAPAEPQPPAPPGAVTEALKRLIDFIPTETITLFWLAVPAAASLYSWLSGNKHKEATCLDWWAFWILLGLTPFLLLLIYLSDLASKKQPRPPLKDWPWWKALAATIAFATWAFAVPGNPFIQEPAVLMAFWVGATLVAILLGLIDPIVEQWCRKRT